MSGFIHANWDSFANLNTGEKPTIPHTDLCILADHRKQERINACNGTDPVIALTAYAQDSLLYTAENNLVEAEANIYHAASINDRLNKFTQTYKTNAPIVLHHMLANIIIDAAIDLYQSHRWKIRVYDGLRTMETAYAMYRHAHPSWLGYDESGNKTLPALLALPGASAHNRALAVDSSVVDTNGCDIERFDNLNMEVSHRLYTGNHITPAQHEARLMKETAIQRAALKNNTLIAPLLSEYWDDRMPGSDADLWRVINSICRCLNIAPPTEKAAHYDMFCGQWNNLDKAKLAKTFGEGAIIPPTYDSIIFHEKLSLIYDRDLPKHLQQAL